MLFDELPQPARRYSKAFSKFFERCDAIRDPILHRGHLWDGARSLSVKDRIDVVAPAFAKALRHQGEIQLMAHQQAVPQHVLDPGRVSGLAGLRGDHLVGVPTARRGWDEATCI